MHAESAIAMFGVVCVYVVDYGHGSIVVGGDVDVGMVVVVAVVAIVAVVVGTVVVAMVVVGVV